MFDISLAIEMSGGTVAQNTARERTTTEEKNSQRFISDFDYLMINDELG